MQRSIRTLNSRFRTILYKDKIIRLSLAKFFSTINSAKEGLAIANPSSWENIGCATDTETADYVKSGVKVYENFVTEEEEKLLMAEIEPQIKRLRYENSHWDDAIHGFRELEKKAWSVKNKMIVDRLQSITFEKEDVLHPQVHVLDLLPTGVIKAHVDSVKFCGSTIAGLCLLSDCIMRFANVKDKQRYADVVLPRFCLYVMKDTPRYDYTHEVLANGLATFNGQNVIRSRRIAILSRNKSKEDLSFEPSSSTRGGYLQAES